MRKHKWPAGATGGIQVRTTMPFHTHQTGKNGKPGSAGKNARGGRSWHRALGSCLIVTPGTPPQPHCPHVLSADPPAHRRQGPEATAGDRELAKPGNKPKDQDREEVHATMGRGHCEEGADISTDATQRLKRSGKTENRENVTPFTKVPTEHHQPSKDPRSRETGAEPPPRTRRGLGRLPV